MSEQRCLLSYGYDVQRCPRCCAQSAQRLSDEDFRPRCRSTSLHLVAGALSLQRSVVIVWKGEQREQTKAIRCDNILWWYKSHDPKRPDHDTFTQVGDHAGRGTPYPLAPHPHLHAKWAQSPPFAP